MLTNYTKKIVEQNYFDINPPEGTKFQYVTINRNLNTGSVSFVEILINKNSTPNAEKKYRSRVEGWDPQEIKSRILKNLKETLRKRYQEKSKESDWGIVVTATSTSLSYLYVSQARGRSQSYRLRVFKQHSITGNEIDIYDDNSLELAKKLKSHAKKESWQAWSECHKSIIKDGIKILLTERKPRNALLNNKNPKESDKYVYVRYKANSELPWLVSVRKNAIKKEYWEGYWEKENDSKTKTYISCQFRTLDKALSCLSKMKKKSVDEKHMKKGKFEYRKIHGSAVLCLIRKTWKDENQTINLNDHSEINVLTHTNTNKKNTHDDTDSNDNIQSSTMNFHDSQMSHNQNINNIPTNQSSNDHYQGNTSSQSYCHGDNRNLFSDPSNNANQSNLKI
ncbi:MAG: hypothetical protein GY782_05665, partial [Gammaproteobacteria bacterium]|nr:hypothetical protein [Gammaproteobacteria bacterium]